MYGLINAEIHPVDIILIFAAAEGDTPKIEVGSTGYFHFS